MLKKIFTWALIIFVGFYVFTNPHGAAALFSSPVHLLQNAGNSLASFIHSL